jgi:hypothetical protein
MWRRAAHFSSDVVGVDLVRWRSDVSRSRCRFRSPADDTNIRQVAFVDRAIDTFHHEPAMR